MKSLYKYPGGKANEIQHFKPFYPSTYKRFVEPFFGGGAVFFDLQHTNNIINDLNKDITTFLKEIQQGHGPQIKDYIDTHFKNDEECYYIVRDGFTTSTEIERSARFFYLRKTCFRGLMRSNKSGKFNVPYGNYKKTDYSELMNNDYMELLKSAIILNTDFNEIFDMLDVDDFVFLDPPYDETFTQYVGEGFDSIQQKQLSERFKQTDAKCMLVINNTPYIQELYGDYIISHYNKKYSITTYSEKIKNTEHLVITNYVNTNPFY